MSEAAATSAAPAPAPNGAIADPPGLSVKAPRGGVAPLDPLARLEAAGIEDGDEPYEDLSELGLETPGQETEGAEAELEQTDEEPENAERQLSQTNGKGTREQPLRHKDLPADTFVELKTADGKRVVVSLKDAVSGAFMSRDMVDRHVSTAKESMARAKQIAENAVQHQERTNANFHAVLGDPQKLVRLLLDRSDGSVADGSILHQLAVATARMRKDPSLRADVLAEMRRERLNQQERETQQRRRALEQQEQETAQMHQLQQELGPAYRRGLKDAGLIAIANELPEDLQDEIRMRFEYVRSRHGKVTPEQMRACVVAGAKAAGYPKAPAARPPSAPKPPEPKQPVSNGKRDWSQVPPEVRMRDPDWLFRRR